MPKLLCMCLAVGVIPTAWTNVAFQGQQGWDLAGALLDLNLWRDCFQTCANPTCKPLSPTISSIGDYTGIIMRKKMETAIIIAYWGYIGDYFSIY